MKPYAHPAVEDRTTVLATDPPRDAEQEGLRMTRPAAAVTMSKIRLIIRMQERDRLPTCPPN